MILTERQVMQQRTYLRYLQIHNLLEDHGSY